MHFVTATDFTIVLIPVGHTVIQCDGRKGGSYLWKGHDFGITLPPDCADGTVNITIRAYLPSSTQEHCLGSAVFKIDITTDVEQFKKPIIVEQLEKPITLSLRFPHWVNIKSDTDKEKLRFLLFQGLFSFKCTRTLQKGSFKVGESLGSISIEVSKNVLLISICKKIAAASFTFMETDFRTDQILAPHQTGFKTPQALVNLEEGYKTEATGEATENKYLDLLVLPADDHGEKWGMYSITLDNPTYLQVNKSRLTIVSCEAKKKQVIHNTRMSYVFTGSHACSEISKCSK